MSQEYKCRPGCLDYEKYGKRACEKCVESWKEFLAVELEGRKGGEN